MHLAINSPLTFDVLDDLLLAHERGRPPSVRLNPGPCLGALMELVCFHEEHGYLFDCVASPEMMAIGRALASRRPVYLENQAVGFVTARRIAYQGSDVHWDAFMLAMHKALLRAGFPSLFSRGLVGAMDEMQANVHEHSDASDTGLIGYRVNPHQVEWTVADRGIGVLTSLRSGAFPSLSDAGEALKVALTDGRSRHGLGKGRGYGFKELFKALSARRGRLRFRSGDHALIVSGDSPSLSRARLQQRADVPGFAVSVVGAKPG